MEKSLSVTFLIVTHVVIVFSQEPVVYPDCIAKRPGNNTEYLTNDSYEKVRTFYMNTYGGPNYESEGDDGIRTANFHYEKTIFEPMGVHITEKNGNSRSVIHVFSQLKGMIVRGILDEARYNEIENKYSFLQNHYFAFVKNESGKLVSADEAIYAKYYKKLGAGGTEATNREATMAEAQKLIMSGKVTEGKAMLERMRDSMIAGIEFAGSAEAVDAWLVCLEEMDAVKYQLSIRIDRQ
jgi:hypothetical protein